MENQTNGKAIASLVLGILSCVCVFFGIAIIFGEIIGIVLGVIGLVLGISARKECPSGMATAGIVLSIISLAVCAVGLLACVACVGCMSAYVIP